MTDVTPEGMRALATEFAMERSAMTVSDSPYAQGLAYVDGEVCALADARLPLVEAGFTRSDVTYNVVAVWNGKFFRLDEHLLRFQRSRDLLHLRPPEETPDIRRILMDMVGRSRLRAAYVSMIATRGMPLTGSRDPRRYANKFYAFACPYIWSSRRRCKSAGSAPSWPRSSAPPGRPSTRPSRTSSGAT